MEALESSSNGTKATSNKGKSSTKDSKQRRSYGVLQPSSASEDMAKAEYSGLVDKTPTDWRSLENYALFSLTSDGLFPMLKVARNKAVRLFDRNVQMVEAGRCYRIMLSSH